MSKTLEQVRKEEEIRRKEKDLTKRYLKGIFAESSDKDKLHMFSNALSLLSFQDIKRLKEYLLK